MGQTSFSPTPHTTRNGRRGNSGFWVTMSGLPKPDTAYNFIEATLDPLPKGVFCLPKKLKRKGAYIEGDPSLLSNQGVAY